MRQEIKKMKNSSYELEVLVNDKPIRTYGFNNKTFVEGRKNQRFHLRFKNNTSSKVLAIISIDGNNVIDGERASKDSNGYIVEAGGVALIKGWRTDLNTTREFIFTGKNQSFGKKVNNCVVNSGSIGCLVISEKVEKQITNVFINEYITKIIKEQKEKKRTPWGDDYPWYPAQPYYPYTNPYRVTYCNSNAQFGTHEGMACNFTNNDISGTELNSSKSVQCKSVAVMDSFQKVDFDLGTGYGKEIQDEVKEVEFKRDKTEALIEIFYASRASLEDMGIDFSKQKKIEVQFPKAFSDTGFCKIKD